MGMGNEDKTGSPLKRAIDASGMSAGMSASMGGPSAKYRIVQIRTRWEGYQAGPDLFEVRVPIGDGHPILNPAWIDQEELSDAEIEAAEFEALKAVVVRK